MHGYRSNCARHMLPIVDQSKFLDLERLWMEFGYKGVRYRFSSICLTPFVLASKTVLEQPLYVPL
ncbi:hypothetical protein L3i20_v218150 [Paenibacillus sp. L3-i20]|nr:hypothetical protein L3i20_v218150 [Paenibacillus sp. L3-i20]